MSRMRITCPARPFALGSAPGPGCPSRTTEPTPASASSQASIKPLGPAPAMTTPSPISAMSLLLGSWFRQTRGDRSHALPEEDGDRDRWVGSDVGVHRRITHGADDGRHQPRIRVERGVGAGCVRRWRRPTRRGAPVTRRCGHRDSSTAFAPRQACCASARRARGRRHRRSPPRADRGGPRSSTSRRVRRRGAGENSAMLRLVRSAWR